MVLVLVMLLLMVLVVLAVLVVELLLLLLTCYCYILLLLLLLLQLSCSSVLYLVSSSATSFLLTRSPNMHTYEYTFVHTLYIHARMYKQTQAYLTLCTYVYIYIYIRVWIPFGKRNGRSKLRCCCRCFGELVALLFLRTCCQGYELRYNEIRKNKKYICIYICVCVLVCLFFPPSQVHTCMQSLDMKHLTAITNDGIWRLAVHCSTLKADAQHVCRCPWFDFAHLPTLLPLLPLVVTCNSCCLRFNDCFPIDLWPSIDRSAEFCFEVWSEQVGHFDYHDQLSKLLGRPCNEDDSIRTCSGEVVSLKEFEALVEARHGEEYRALFPIQVVLKDGISVIIVGVSLQVRWYTLFVVVAVVAAAVLVVMR